MNKPLDFPPPLNNALAEWLQAQEPGLGGPELYEMCRYMHSQFTQFNEKSNLKVVGEKLIVNKYLHSEYGQTVFRPFKKPAPGLRAKLARFWTKVMPRSYWVVLGERFPHLYRRYDGWDYGSVAEPDAQFTRTVKLTRVGFHQQLDMGQIYRGELDPRLPHFVGEFEFQAGYEALTDTLYLHERIWVRTGDDYRMGRIR